MNSTFVIVNYFISGLVTIWAVFRIYQLIISDESLYKAIELNLNTEKHKVKCVSRLSPQERIKYGVPMPGLEFYNYFFGIFTGKIENDRLYIPEGINKGWVVKVKEKSDSRSRYDFIYLDKDGYENTIGGLSRLFNKEYWNYAKLISGI